MRHGMSGTRYTYSGCQRAFPSQKQQRIITGDKAKYHNIRMGFILDFMLSSLRGPHSTSDIHSTTWPEVIPTTSTFASGSTANHTKEMYLCTLHAPSTILVNSPSLEHQCRSSTTSRVFILSLHFHHCETKFCSQQAPWKWLKGNIGTEAVIVVWLFH